MIDTIIVSGGNIHSDFALDFLKKNEACLIAADKGLEFFLEHQLLPDAVIGDFDSLSASIRISMTASHQNSRQLLTNVARRQLSMNVTSTVPATMRSKNAGNPKTA